MPHTAHDTAHDVSAPRTARERVRVELTNEIKAVAREHLREHGASDLSLRAIARQLGMVSSAVYRYFPSRDELLTALIVDAYLDLGTTVQLAESGVARTDHTNRWMAICRATRAWALAAPQQYALIFGSPIPGYAAPVDTIDPAAMVPLTMIAVFTDAAAAGALAEQPTSPKPVPMPAAVRADMKQLRDSVLANDLDDRLLARGVMAWTQLVGSISFELFGHLNNVIGDLDAYFEYQMRTVAAGLGLGRH